MVAFQYPRTTPKPKTPRFARFARFVVPQSIFTLPSIPSFPWFPPFPKSPNPQPKIPLYLGLIPSSRPVSKISKSTLPVPILWDTKSPKIAHFRIYCRLLKHPPPTPTATFLPKTFPTKKPNPLKSSALHLFLQAPRSKLPTPHSTPSNFSQNFLAQMAPARFDLHETYETAEVLYLVRNTNAHQSKPHIDKPNTSKTILNQNKPNKPNLS